LMICSAECRFLAMFSCLPKCVYSAILSHKEWTSFWGAGHSGIEGRYSCGKCGYEGDEFQIVQRPITSYEARYTNYKEFDEPRYLSAEQIRQDFVPNNRFNAQYSILPLQPNAAIELVGDLPGNQSLPELQENEDPVEGGRRIRTHIHRERKSRRKERLGKMLREEGSYFCEACGTESPDTELPMSILEVHHIVPLAQAEGERVTTLDDLAVLCANCHRLIHAKMREQGNTDMSIVEFKAIFGY